MILTKSNHIKIYGHRGARGDLPENTLDSFEFLFENKITAYETDTLLTKDLVPTVNHDFRLNPALTKNSKGDWIENDDIRIFNLTYEELFRFKIGSIDKKSKYGKRFKNQKILGEKNIPKLSDLLELTSNNISDNLIINLEIKSTPVENNLTPPPNVMARLIVDEVNKTELKDKVIYSSFDWRVLKEIKNIDPKISRAYLTSDLKGIVNNKSPWLDFIPLKDSDSRELPRLIKALGGKAWHSKSKDINKDMVRISHEEGLAVNVWTVNEKYEMFKMIEYGVDGIITDYPLRLKKLCEDEGINWF